MRRVHARSATHELIVRGLVVHRSLKTTHVVTAREVVLQCATGRHAPRHTLAMGELFVIVWHRHVHHIGVNQRLNFW